MFGTNAFWLEIAIALPSTEHYTGSLVALANIGISHPTFPPRPYGNSIGN